MKVGQLYKLTGTGFDRAKGQEATVVQPAATVARVTLATGMIHDLVATTVEFRINQGGNLGRAQLYIRLCTDGKTTSYHISNFSQLMGPARRGFTGLLF